MFGPTKVLWVFAAALAIAAGLSAVQGSRDSSERTQKAQALIESAKSRIRLQDLRGAIEDLSGAIALEPGNAAAFRLRGLARQAEGNNDGAVADLDVAIRIDPKDGGAYNTRGVALMGKGNLGGAIEDFSRAVGCDGRNAIVRFNRAVARERLGEWNGVVMDCENGLVLWREGRPQDDLTTVAIAWQSPEQMVVDMARRLQTARKRRGPSAPVSARVY